MEKQMQTRSDLRKFGITMTVALVLIGALLLWRDKSYYVYSFVIAGAFLSLGLAAPALLKPVYTAWMRLAIVLGEVMSTLILMVLFYAVMTPLALILGLCGKTPLSIRFQRDSSQTYWIKRDETNLTLDDYKRQF